MGAGAQEWELSSVAFLVHKQRAEFEVERLGLKLVPTWHASIACRSLECYAMVPAQFQNNFKWTKHKDCEIIQSPQMSFTHLPLWLTFYIM